MNINKLIENTDELVYGKKVEIPSLGIELVTYKSIESKFGLAKRLLSVLFDYEKGVYDGVNAKMFIPIFFLEAYSDDLEFPEDMTDLDVSGLYDMISVSGVLQEIYVLLGHELLELESIMDEIVKIEYRKKDSKNPLEDFLKDIEGKNPEDIEKMTSQIKELMKDENVQNMVKFKEQGDN
jgi:hypothetical protein